MTDIVIPSFFEEGDVDPLFSNWVEDFESLHLAVIQRRKKFEAPDVAALAVELPDGAYIVGRFMHHVLKKQTPKDYDIFFSGQEAVTKMIARIQKAPEGSFLHGYAGEDSLGNFKDGYEVYLKFVHPTKPPIKLFRHRWFATLSDAIARVDLSISQFGIDNRLMTAFGPNFFTDVEGRYVRVTGPVPFNIGTGLRIQRLEADGYKWMNGRYDTWTRQDWTVYATNYMKDQKTFCKNNKLPVPKNEGDFGLFEIRG